MGKKKFNYVAESLLDEIKNEINDLPITIEEFLKENLKLIIKDEYSIQYTIDGLLDHLFEKHNGTVSNSKLNFIKNGKSISFQLIDPNNFNKTVNFYDLLNEKFMQFIEKIDIPFNKFIESIDIDTEESNKLSTFFHSFSSAISASYNDMFTLRQLLRNISITDRFDNNKFKNIPKDKLKKYYFTNTLELKNNIKVFNCDNMLYGETNNIMRSYNRVIDFIYTDFVFYYNTLKFITDNIRENKE